MAESYEKMNLYKRAMLRHGDMKQQRQPWDANCNTIVEYCRPDLINRKDPKGKRGSFMGSSAVEGSAFFSELTWQKGFMGLQVGAKINWLRYFLNESEKAVKEYFKGNDRVNSYLQDFRDYMLEVYRNSNYYSAMPGMVLDGGTVGSPVMLIEEDIPNRKNVCLMPHYTQRYLMVDWFGNDIALHIEHEVTILQAAGFIGKDNLPKQIQQKLEQGDHKTTVKLLQCIYRAGDQIFQDLPEPVLILGPWMEFYFVEEQLYENEKKPVRSKPYHSKPFIGWHYSRKNGESYSRTPAWWAIYDIKGNAAGWGTLYLTAEKQADPPMILLQKMKARANLNPGGRVYALSQDEYASPPKPIDQNQKYPFVVDFMDRLKMNIDRHFAVDLFMPINRYMQENNQPPTAYQIMQMEAEKNVQLGPSVESYEGFLGEIDARMMEIERQAERLPDAPPEVLELSEGRIDPIFVGPLAQAQRIGNILQKLNTGVNIAGMIGQFDQMAAQHKIDWPGLLEKALEDVDFYQDMIVPQEAYTNIVESIQAELRQQQAIENLPKQAQAVKALSGKTDPIKLLTGAA